MITALEKKKEMMKVKIQYDYADIMNEWMYALESYDFDIYGNQYGEEENRY